MRSLWWQMVLQWLGSAGSEALAGDSDRADGLPCATTVPVFRVARDPCARRPVRPTVTAPDAADREDFVLPVNRRS
ncbi:MAG: hypothetical protein ACREFK_15315 [Stellaceae bacterium]